jgi:hypothetical protein
MYAFGRVSHTTPVDATESTNLSSVCEEERLRVVQLDGFTVELDGTRVVTCLEGLVALILEVDG